MIVMKLSLGRLLLMGVPLLTTLVLAWGQGGAVLADDSGPRMSFNASGAGVSCDAASAPTECAVPVGGAFTLTVEARGASGYIGIQTSIVYSGVRYNATGEIDEELIWPDLAGLIVRAPASPTGAEGFVKHGGATGNTPPFPESDFEGTILQLGFTCSTEADSFDLALLSFDFDNNPTGSGFKLADLSDVPAKVVDQGNFDLNGDGTLEPAGISDTLTVDCEVAPAPTAPPAATQAPAGATATPRIVSTGSGGASDGGSNTGLWVLIGVLAAVGSAAGLGVFAWRRVRTGT